MYKQIIIILLLVVTNIINAQYRVEVISISGELTQDDPYDPNFGRFDAVELYLNKGDVISISLKSDFPPFIALVAPSEKYFVEYTKDGSSITDYIQTINESGTWYLSIAADSSDFGHYDLAANYMSANSITIPADAGYCTTLKFLLEHSNSNFSFMKKSRIEGDDKIWESNINFSNSISNRIIENKNKISRYSSVLLNTKSRENADSFYTNIVEETKLCLGSSWVTNSKDQQKTSSNSIIKEYLFATIEKEIKKNIKIFLKENKDTVNTYEVSLEFGVIK